MTLEMRIRIFLTKYKELVEELGLSISPNYIDNTPPLILRINPELKREYGKAEEGCPSYINFFGDDPEYCSFFAILSSDNGKTIQLDPFDDIPTFDKPHCKTEEEIQAELKALGLM